MCVCVCMYIQFTLILLYMYHSIIDLNNNPQIYSSMVPLETRTMCICASTQSMLSMWRFDPCLCARHPPGYKYN